MLLCVGGGYIDDLITLSRASDFVVFPAVNREKILAFFFVSRYILVATRASR